MPTSYYEFTVRVPDESRDAIIYKLAEMGSPGLYEGDGNIIAYFEDKGDVRKLCGELDEFRKVLDDASLNPVFSYDYVLLPEKDWNESWKKNFSPIDIGNKLTIVPSWVKADTDRLPVIIDPGQVFGTGHHESTRTCLILIERFSEDFEEKSFLDIGTGTGILAIAAARLGFSPVTAIDNDPMSVEACLFNVELNCLKDIVIKKGEITDVEGTFDFISANLLAETLLQIAQEIASRLGPGGSAILSGMLVGQEDEVIKSAEMAGLKFRKKVVDDKWVSLVVERP
ncbi:MAG: 50S ribosomal protein L11 methyltransferase [Nitrospiraceae bacterium]|nr:MAG: 50S ribosomal protein L11 methyltransferase [Nitrospiraceae bacterium]